MHSKNSSSKQEEERKRKNKRLQIIRNTKKKAVTAARTGDVSANDVAFFELVLVVVEVVALRWLHHFCPSWALATHTAEDEALLTPTKIRFLFYFLKSFKWSVLTCAGLVLGIKVAQLGGAPLKWFTGETKLLSSGDIFLLVAFERFGGAWFRTRSSGFLVGHIDK